MPVTVELKYEYFLTWPGKLKIVEVVSKTRLDFHNIVHEEPDFD